MLEKSEHKLASQKWRNVTLVEWQPITITSAVVIPALWVALEAVPAGVAVGVAVGVGGLGWWGALAGWCVALVWFAVRVGVAIEWARTAEQSRQEYDAGETGGAMASRSVVRLEVKEQQSTGYSRYVYDELETDLDTLRALAGASRLSVRGLGDAGISSDVAVNLLSALIGRGYAMREASNKPAKWTAKGTALVRALS